MKQIQLFLLLLLALGWWSMPFASIGDRLGIWIAARGWDSGPHSEYPYDFLLFWHLGLSCLVYSGLLQKRCSPEDMAFAWRYPLLSLAVLWVFPWNAENGAHKVFALLVYPGLFWPLLSLASSIRATRTRIRILRLLCLGAAAAAFVTPVTGGGVLTMAHIILAFLLVGWACLDLYPLETAAGHAERWLQHSFCSQPRTTILSAARNFKLIVPFCPTGMYPPSVLILRRGVGERAFAAVPALWDGLARFGKSQRKTDRRNEGGVA